MIGKLEKFLICFLFTALVSVIGIQIFESYGFFKTQEASNLENGAVTLENSENYYAAGVIKLYVENVDELHFLINGEEKLYAKDENNIIAFSVIDSDVVEIDSRSVNEEINVYVYDVSENILNPKKGEKYNFSKEIKYLFTCNVE